MSDSQTTFNATEITMGTPNTTADETSIASAAVGPNVLRVGDSFVCSGVEPMSIHQAARICVKSRSYYRSNLSVVRQ